MPFAVVIGVLSAIVVLIVMSRINLKRFMGYPATLDATVTVFLAWLLHGSYVGMVAAIVGGLFFSCLITVIRYTYGYSVLERQGCKLKWVEYHGMLPDFKQYQTFVKRQRDKVKSLPVLWLILGVLLILNSM